MHLHFWRLISTFQWVFAVSNLCSVHVNIRAVLWAVVAMSRARVHPSVRTQTCHVTATTDYKIYLQYIQSMYLNIQYYFLFHSAISTMLPSSFSARRYVMTEYYEKDFFLKYFHDIYSCYSCPTCEEWKDTSIDKRPISWSRYFISISINVKV